MEFGEWLKQKRHELDLTQAALAEAVNCAIDTIRKIEAGKRRPSRQLAELLADYFGTSPDEREAFVHRARGIHDRGGDVAELATQESDPVDSHARATEFPPSSIPSQQGDVPDSASTKARRSVDEVNYRAAWTAGQGMSLEDAAIYALQLD